MSEVGISVRGLRKAYGGQEAVRGIDFEVGIGEVFGFLGPNGAGKTTTIEILEGYRERSGGEVTVLGTDPAEPTRAWRERVGLVLQECELDPLLTVREAVNLYATFYRAPRPVDETIDLAGLAEKRNARIGSLSGGQKRRVDVAIGIVGDPELIFLDEPTTGFDPTVRREAWNMIEGLKAIGKTVFLTTSPLARIDRQALPALSPRTRTPNDPGSRRGRQRPRRRQRRRARRLGAGRGAVIATRRFRWEPQAARD